MHGISLSDHNIWSDFFAYSFIDDRKRLVQKNGIIDENSTEIGSVILLLTEEQKSEK